MIKLNNVEISQEDLIKEITGNKELDDTSLIEQNIPNQDLVLQLRVWRKSNPGQPGQLVPPGTTKQTMKNLICKLFGHKIVRLNTKRMFAWCDRCDKGLKVSYDMTYSETIVTGDYGNQRTFCWCDCGNELCSTDSLVKDEAYVEYKCSKCGKESKWDFDTPVPIEIRKNPL